MLPQSNMATASGFSFGGSTGLFGATAKTTASALPAFGTATAAAQPASSGLSFGLTKTPAVGATPGGLSLGLGSNTTAGSTAFSFGKPSASVSAFSIAKTTQATQQLGLGTLSTAATSNPGLGLGQNLFGAKPIGTATAPFQLTAASNQNATLSAFGTAGPSSIGISSASTINSSNAPAPIENPKDAQVPAPLMEVFKALSKHIKEQRAKKDEIARFSSQLISKATEEITALKQLVSEVSNGMQRDAVGVQNLKAEVLQELNFSEIARRVHDVAPSLQHDYKAPMEYFQYLAGSFETRLSAYRQQLDELESYLSSSSALNEFSPQDLFAVLRKLNDTFLALAAQLQVIHEAAKAIKDKYAQYRRVVLHDNSDIFGFRSRMTQRNGGVRGTGPCPFSGLAGPSGSTILANVHGHTMGSQPSSKLGTFGNTNMLGQQPLLKSVPGLAGSGLSRSLSFSGMSSRGSGTSTSLGSSFTSNLFGKTGPASNTPQFQLQNPPGTKRGKPN